MKAKILSLITIFIFNSLSLWASDNIHLESQEAVYEDQTIVLIESVNIDHPLGTIRCEEASLSHLGSLKQLKIESLTLKNNVKEQMLNPKSLSKNRLHYANKLAGSLDGRASKRIIDYLLEKK